MKPVKPLSPAYDWIIVGGGLVGASIAYGLIQKQPQLRILVLDGSDTDYRASVGNFGLIWVQGKGHNFPAYANWSLQGADLWPFSTYIGIVYCCPKQPTARLESRGRPGNEFTLAVF